MISDDFRAGILNGRRAELLSEFDLEREEVAEVMAIRAHTLAEFASAVEKIVRSRESTVPSPSFSGKEARVVSGPYGGPALPAIAFRRCP